MGINWRPSASMAVLQARAQLLDGCRKFFAERDVLEVVTPALSSSATTEPNIDSLQVKSRLKPEQNQYLHTSPEFAMKRLLAAGSGAIYQICSVFRDSDFGPQHRAEFSMLEWYRPEWTYRQLMEEVRDLIFLLAKPGKIEQTRQISYRQLFQSHLDLDPFTVDAFECRNCCAQNQVSIPENMGDRLDPWLDLLLSALIVPQLPANNLTFIYDFPASQAALARTREQGEVTVAERFELYWANVELANGFQELADAKEQARRFANENRLRDSDDQPRMPVDELFLMALEAGFPDCSGVALGLDRLLMKLTETSDIAQVMTFDYCRK